MCIHCNKIKSLVVNDRVKQLPNEIKQFLSDQSTHNTYYSQSIYVLVKFGYLDWPLTVEECESVVQSTEPKHVRARILMFWEPDNIPNYINLAPSVKLYHYTNNIHNVPKCYCGNDTRWSNKQKRYTIHCSNKCRSLDPEVEGKRKATCIDRYGTDKNFKNDNHLQLTRDSYKNTTGFEYPFQNSEVTVKSNSQKRKIYGDDWRTVIANKASASLQRKYGGDNFGESVSGFIKTRTESRIRSWLNNRLASLETTTCISDKSEYVDKNHKLKFKCNHCDNVFFDYLRDGKQPRCIICSPLNSTNWKQQELFDWCNTLDTQVIFESRKIINPKELDVYFPTRNVALEFNGLYWHSDVGSRFVHDKFSHSIKTDMCDNKNIELLHIFEDEWNGKQDIVKSIIKQKLNLGHNRIYGRQCKIRSITNLEYKTFCDINHLQGPRPAALKYGLTHDDEIICIMSFGKSRYSKSHDWEMIRLCTKLNYSVVGGASKLFKYFIKQEHPTSIITYADRRWFNGSVYAKLGFTHSHNSTPGYYYVDINSGCTERLNRIAFQKHKLADQLEVFDVELSETANMHNNGYAKIWDVGQLVYTWEMSV